MNLTIKKGMLLIVSILLVQIIVAQHQTNTAYNGWRLGANIGYDLAKATNTANYVQYENGWLKNGSLNYYSNHWGFGFDADLVTHQTTNLYPTTNLLNNFNVPVLNINKSTTVLKRQLYYVGPNYQIAPTKAKWAVELMARVGISSAKGGSVLVQDVTTPRLANFFAGYNQKHVLGTKLQLKFNYLLLPKLALNVGGYYIHQHKTAEYIDPSLLITSQYQPYIAVGSNIKYNGAVVSTAIPTLGSINSYGASIGLHYLFNKKKKKEVKNTTTTLTVTAVDKISGVVMPNTTVVLKSATCATIATAITNDKGIAVFEKLNKDTYELEATIADQQFEKLTINATELDNKKQVATTIYYNDKNFIINGAIYQCNTTNPLPGTKVVIMSNDGFVERNTVTNELGTYQLQVVVGKQYQLYGQKENYFSNIEQINPANYNRAKTLFINLQICSEVLDCKNTIKLKAVLFDVAKYDLNTAAKTELDKLVRFMLDNEKVKVELGAHTDSRGAAADNQILSQKRANASVAYIVSKGVAVIRIAAVGYGETQLLNKCNDATTCTETEHQQNRRIEIKIVCK